MQNLSNLVNEPEIAVGPMAEVAEVSPVLEVPNVVEVYTGIDLPDFEVVRPKRMTKVLKKKITKC
jgi:hypothetical protein